jgi:Domain of unknown function (DUF1918)
MPKQTIARVGDSIEIHGHVQGQPPRRGLVLEVLGTGGHEHYRVGWDDEHESIFFPGPDARVPPRSKRARTGESRARRSAVA